MAEQGDVVVGHEVVGDAAVAAVADVGLGQEVVDQGVELGPVAGHGGPVAPDLDQVEAEVGVDHVDVGLVELVDAEVAVGRGPELVGGHAPEVAGGLGGAEEAAIGESREHIAPQWVGQLGVRARGRPEPAPPVQPVGGAGQDVEQRPLGHPLLDRLLQCHRGGAAVLALAALQRRHPGHLVDDEVGVVGVAGVHLGRLGHQRRPQLLGELGGGGGQARFGAELLEQWAAVLPRQQLGRPVGEGLGAVHGDVAGAQGLGQVGEHTSLEMATGQPALVVAATDQALPLFGGEGQVDHHSVGVAIRSRVRWEWATAWSRASSTDRSALVASSSTVRAKANIVARSRRKLRSTSGM